MTLAIVPSSDPEARVWATALEVSALFADMPWVLIGAQMVMLLELESGRTSGRTTGDVDAVVDVRAVAGGTRAAAERLVAAGFELAAAQHPYRFQRADAQVDILAPDHLGPNAISRRFRPRRQRKFRAARVRWQPRGPSMSASPPLAPAFFLFRRSLVRSW